MGTTGVYVNLDAANPSSPLVTGASLLGAVPDFSDIFAVPGVDPATRFDVFPGAPAITDAGVIAFKGNYSVDDPASDDPEVTIGKTGVFYRPVVARRRRRRCANPAGRQLGHRGAQSGCLCAGYDVRIDGAAKCRR